MAYTPKKEPMPMKQNKGKGKKRKTAPCM